MHGKTDMEGPELIRAAWPRGGFTLQGIDWRDRLHRALQRYLDRAPQLADLSYHTHSDPVTETYITTVDVTLGEETLRFRGVEQDNERMAIRCAAWVALVNIQERLVPR